MNPRNGNVILNGKKIEISWDFNPADRELLTAIQDLPDRRFVREERVWTLPSSPYHCAQVVQALRPFGFWIDREIAARATQKAPKPPKLRLPDELREYQKVGVSLMYAFGGRCVLADDPGLGKTIMTLVFLHQFVQGRVLIVAPASVLGHWANKAAIWAPGNTTQIIWSGKEPIGNADYTAMSYTIMANRQEELAALPFDTIVFDESHKLKNYKTQRTKAAKVVAKGVPHIICLSGTPFMNKRMELFPNLNLIDPKTWTNAISYGIRYCGGVFQYRMWVHPPDGETHTEELQQRLQHILIRRTQQEAAPEIPELTRTMIPVELTNQAEYDRARLEVKDWFQHHHRVTKAQKLTQLNKLRHMVGLGKVTSALEMAEDVLQSGQQVVLFAHHKDVVAALEQGLQEYGVGTIDGDLAPKKRDPLKEAFLSKTALIDGKPFQVMIISTAGGEGIDLYSASTIIFAEREWTPMQEEQIEDRLKRHGQQNHVNAYYPIAKGTVDEHMNEIVQAKRTQFGRLFKTDVVQEVWEAEFGGE